MAGQGDVRAIEIHSTADEIQIAFVLGICAVHFAAELDGVRWRRRQFRIAPGNAIQVRIGRYEIHAWRMASARESHAIGNVNRTTIDRKRG